MTKTVRHLIESFEALSPAEKQEAVVEVLRRAMREVPPNLPDETLMAAADALFGDLDAREAADAKS
jgi:hypothetical protein